MLRMKKDTTNEEREKRIQEVLIEVIDSNKEPFYSSIYK